VGAKYDFGRTVGTEKDYRRSPVFDGDSLCHFAKVCRVSTFIRPYLETVLHA